MKRLDLLNGAGDFSSTSVLSAWQGTDSKDYTFELYLTFNRARSKDSALKMKKSDSGSHAYNDGLWISFADSRPQHLSFSFMASTGDAEAFDLRIGKRVDNVSVDSPTQSIGARGGGVVLQGGLLQLYKSQSRPNGLQTRDREMAHGQFPP